MSSAGSPPGDGFDPSGFRPVGGTGAGTPPPAPVAASPTSPPAFDFAGFKPAPPAPSLFDRMAAPVGAAIRETGSEIGAGADEISQAARDMWAANQLSGIVDRAKAAKAAGEAFPATSAQTSSALRTGGDIGKAALGVMRILGAPVAGGVDALVAQPIARAFPPGSPARRFASATANDLGLVLAPEVGERALVPLVKGGKALVRGVEAASKLPGRYLGTAAKDAAEALRAGAQKALEKPLGASLDAINAYRARAAAAEHAMGEIAKSQPKTAEERALAQATRTTIRGRAFADERDAALLNLRARAKALEDSYLRAGASADAAKALVAEHEAKISDAESAVTALEREMLAKPRATAEDFGAKIRDITKNLSDRYSAERERQAGFGAALASAGDAPRVDTRAAQDVIDRALKTINNPETERILARLRERLSTGNTPALSLAKADSLRKYINDAAGHNRFDDLTLSPEASHLIGRVQAALTDAAKASWQPYREALAKWSALSRPLDIVERNGALKRVLDADPLSKEYALTKAQVVGDVIAKARAGNPVFERLISESPDLRDSARLYFTQDLFGKDAVPTEGAFRNWLAGNERPLKQLGLYDEFSSLKSAREAAQRAVEEAKGVRAGSVAEARARAAEASGAKARAAAAARLRDLEAARVMERQAAASGVERRLAAAAKRAGEARTRLAREGKAATTAADREALAASHWRQFDTELRTAPPERVPTEARALFANLRRDGIIDDARYEAALRQVDEVTKTFHDSAEARKMVRNVALWTVVSSGLGWAGWHVLHPLFGAL